MKERLQELLAGMDVPVTRRELKSEDVRWLLRNLAIRNSAHPAFTEASDLLKKLAKLS